MLKKRYFRVVLLTVLLVVILFLYPSEKAGKLCCVDILDSTGAGRVKFDLRPGDLLVRPNNNILPGSSIVDGGRVFGHAAIVVEGAEGATVSDVLSKAVVVEALFFDQATRSFIFSRAKQIRSAQAAFSFGKRFEGIRYRLRLPMEDQQREKIVRLAQGLVGNGRYSIFLTKSSLMKRVDNPKDVFENDTDLCWNCTSLIWYLYRSVLMIDIDSNGGAFIFPNDLLNSTQFNQPEGCIMF